MALISSGYGTAVAVGTGVNVWVGAGVAVGSGMSVEAGAAVGVGKETALAPHADKMRDNTMIQDQ